MIAPLHTLFRCESLYTYACKYVWLYVCMYVCMVVCSVALKSSSPRRPSTVARSPSTKPTAKPSVKPTKKPGTGVRFLREENPDLSRTVSAVLTPSAAPGGLVGVKKSSKAPSPPPSRAPVIINPAGMQPCAHTYIHT